MGGCLTSRSTTSSGTNVKLCGWVEGNKGENILGEREGGDIEGQREDRVKGKGFGDSHKDGFEELDTIVDAIIRLLEVTPPRLSYETS